MEAKVVSRYLNSNNTLGTKRDIGGDNGCHIPAIAGLKAGMRDEFLDP